MLNLDPVDAVVAELSEIEIYTLDFRENPRPRANRDKRVITIISNCICGVLQYPWLANKPGFEGFSPQPSTLEDRRSC